MQGNLLHYNFGTKQGLIRAEDGRRYAFEEAQWRSDRRPAVGDELDFEVQGTVAYDVYATKPASAQVDLTRIRESVTQGARQLGDSETGRRFLAGWGAIIALVTLLGCFLPYISVGNQSASLFGVGSQIGQMVDTLDQLENLGRLMKPSRPGFNSPVAQPPQFDAVRWSLRIAYLLYLIPVLAVLAVAYELLNRPTRRVLFWQGLTSLVLPIAVPIMLSAMIYSLMPADMRQIMSQSGAGNMSLSFFGIGFWFLIAAGIAQLLNRSGFFRKSPRSLVPSS